MLSGSKKLVCVLSSQHCSYSRCLESSWTISQNISNLWESQISLTVWRRKFICSMWCPRRATAWLTTHSSMLQKLPVANGECSIIVVRISRLVEFLWDPNIVLDILQQCENTWTLVCIYLQGAECWGHCFGAMVYCPEGFGYSKGDDWPFLPQTCHLI